MKVLLLLVAVVSFVAGAAVDPCELDFARIGSRRFALDGELALCEYLPATAVAKDVQYPIITNATDRLTVVGAFWPAAHYCAHVEKLPAEIAFATVDGKVPLRFRVEGKKLPKPPFDFSVILACRHSPSVFVTKNGATTLLRTEKLPDDFNPRLKTNLQRLKFCVGGGVTSARASLSAGIGQADVRFVTEGRQNRLYMEDGRVFFTFSSRSYGSSQGVASFDPSRFDVRFEGTILFDYGDGELRNDIASHLFHDVDGTWKGWSSNFSTGSDQLSKRGEGGLNAIWCERSPLHGLSIMHGKSLGMKGMNEDPCGTWDAEAKCWTLLVSEFTPAGICASTFRSPNWDGPFTRIAGPVDHNSTGTTITFIDGRRWCFSGSSEQACYVYTYPDLKLHGSLKFDFPPWNNTSCRNGRVWPCIAELPAGYPFRYLMLTMDRACFPGMPRPNWTYGGLILYGAN